MTKPSQLNQPSTNIRQGKVQVDFSAGWVANMYPEVAPREGVRDLLNFELSTRFPNPTKIDGYAQFNSSGQRIEGSGAVYWMDILYHGKGDEDYVLAARASGGEGVLWGGKRTDKKFARMDTGTAGLSVQAIQATTFQIGQDMWEYMVGGGNIKTDGSQVLPVGNPPPSTGFSLSSSGTGSIDGTTTIRVSYVYGDHGEGNVGDSKEITVSSSNIKIDSLPTSSNPLVTKRKIYRDREKRDTGDYWLAKTIDDNSTTTTTLTTKGSVIIANQAQPEDNSQIPDAQIVENYANRVFYAGGSIEKGRIIYSKELKPDVYEAPDNSPSPNVIDTIRGRDGIVMAMAGTQTNLYILTQNGVWVLNGRVPSSWTFQRIHDVGTLSPDTVLTIEGKLFWLGADLENVYASDGRRKQPIGGGLSNYLSRLDWPVADRFWAIHDTKRDEYRLHVKHEDDPPDSSSDVYK